MTHPVQELVKNTDCKKITMNGSAFSDLFQYSKDPIWQINWNERMKPNLKSGDDNKLNALRNFVLENENLICTILPCLLSYKNLRIVT